MCVGGEYACRCLSPVSAPRAPISTHCPPSLLQPEGPHPAQARDLGSSPTAAPHTPSTMEAQPAPPFFCINIDLAGGGRGAVAHRGSTVPLTRACHAPQTPEMFVEGWEPPWAPHRASTFILGKITGISSPPPLKCSLMASGGERSLGIKTSQECEAHPCARCGLSRRRARGRTLQAASLAAVVCLGFPCQGLVWGRASWEISRPVCPHCVSYKGALHR